MKEAEASTSSPVIRVLLCIQGVYYGLYSIFLLVLSIYIMRKYPHRKNVFSMAIYLVVLMVAFVIETIYLFLFANVENNLAGTILDPIVSLLWHGGFLFFIYVQLRANAFMFLRYRLNLRYKVLSSFLIASAVVEVPRNTIEIIGAVYPELTDVADILMPFVYVLYITVILGIVLTRRRYDREKYNKFAASYLAIGLFFVFVLFTTLAYSIIVLSVRLSQFHKDVMHFVLNITQDLMPLICVKFIFDVLLKSRSSFIENSLQAARDSIASQSAEDDTTPNTLANIQ
jgi:hypothetical protein